MKRVVIVILLLLTAVTNTGCLRGMRSWGCRGARCGTPYYPYSPPPTYAAPPPAYAPSYCPPVECPPMTSYSDPCLDSGGYYGAPNYSTPPATTPPSMIDPGATTMSFPSGLPDGTVMYSKPIADRIVNPGEILPAPGA